MSRGDEYESAWLRSSQEDPAVEVAYIGDEVLVRSSDKPGAIIRFTREEFAGFLADVNEGKFDDI